MIEIAAVAILIAFLLAMLCLVFVFLKWLFIGSSRITGRKSRNSGSRSGGGFFDSFDGFGDSGGGDSGGD